MTAKEMFLNIEDISEYRENKHQIEIYEKTKNEPFICFHKGTKIIVFKSILADEKQNIYNSFIDMEELKAINKQIEELGWNNE